MSLILPEPTEIAISGYCKTCQTHHTLPVGNAGLYAVELMEQLEQEGRIDFFNPPSKSNQLFSTDILWGEERGQMFGVLVCEDSDGNEVVLKAFSCQHNGEWSCPGWAPPLVDSERYLFRCREVGQEIKKMTSLIQSEELSEDELTLLKNRRKEMSQKLMKELHEMYLLHNFNGESATLDEAFAYDKGIPSGTGDCCAPKLLNQAACLGLKPMAIAEFFWGRANKSGTKQHKHFYPSCETKCEPILGFLLCGAEHE